MLFFKHQTFIYLFSMQVVYFGKWSQEIEVGDWEEWKMEGRKSESKNETLVFKFYLYVFILYLSMYLCFSQSVYLSV